MRSAGTVPAPPAYSAGHLSANPAPGRTERLPLPFPVGLLRSLRLPLFSPKSGHTEDLREFVQPGSVGQVCQGAHTLRGNEWHLRAPRPGCSPTLSPPAPPGSGRAREKGRGSGDPGRQTSAGGHRAARQGAPGVGATEKFGSIPKTERQRFESKNTGRGGGGVEREAKEQHSLRHGRWGRRWLSSAGPRPGAAPRAGAPASDFRGGGFCLLCRRRRSCGCRGS